MLEILKEINEILRSSKSPKLNQEEANNLNRVNTSEETEAVIKGLPTIEGPRPDKFRAEFYQTLKEDVQETLLKLFKNRTRGSTPKLLLQS